MAEPINTKKDIGAPTPQNTPLNTSTLQPPSRQAAGSQMASISEGGALSQLAANPALLQMIQGRLGTLIGRQSNYIKDLPQPIRERIAGLKALRLENAALEGEFHRELLELEKKYAAKHEPLYKRRARIIAGDEEPTSDEVIKGQEALDEEEEALNDLSDDEDEDEDEDEEDDDEDDEEKPTAAAESDDAAAAAGIPGFWFTALQNLPGSRDLISERDDGPLQHLMDIRLKYIEKPGFALEFVFEDNSYFTNKVLTKTYYYQEEIGINGDFVYDHAEGDEIKWTSPESNVTVTVEKRKQRNKHTKATRTIEKIVPTESFFNFFSPPSLEGDDEEEEYDEEIYNLLERDFDLGELMKEKLVPRAIDWFTGKALEYEGMAGDDDEGEYDMGSEEEEEDDDDDENEDGEGAAGQKPAECKQQ